MQLQGATWGDGSPMVNHSFQVCSFHTLYDHTQYAHGKAAEQDCRRPQLWVVQQAGDSLADLSYQGGVRLKDMQTLNEPLERPNGLPLTTEILALEGDDPELKRRTGAASGQSAMQACYVCTSFASRSTCLAECACAPHRSMADAAALAEKAKAVCAERAGGRGGGGGWGGGGWGGVGGGRGGG